MDKFIKAKVLWNSWMKLSSKNKKQTISGAAVFSPYASVREMLKFSLGKFPTIMQYCFHAKVNNSWYVLWTQHFSWISAWCTALFTMSTFLPPCLPFANQFYQHSLRWRMAFKICRLLDRNSYLMQMITVNRSLLISYKNPAMAQNHSWLKLK